MLDIFNLSGWLVWCQFCHENRPVTVQRDRDVDTREEYFELVCCRCASIILTFQRAEVTKRLNEAIPN